MTAQSPAFPKAGNSSPGMNLRAYIATAALEGVISAYSGEGIKLPEEEYAARIAVQYADALLRELEITE